MSDFQHAIERRAAKPHQCNECRCEIKPGEYYERAEGRWDGDFETFKTCADCLGFREYVRAEYSPDLDGFDFMYGSVLEDYREEIQEAHHSTPGWFKPYRMLAVIKHKQQAQVKGDSP